MQPNLSETKAKAFPTKGEPEGTGCGSVPVDILLMVNFDIQSYYMSQSGCNKRRIVIASHDNERTANIAILAALLLTLAPIEQGKEKKRRL